MRSILLRMVESCASVDCFSCRSFARYDRWRRARWPRDLPILCESSSMASLVDDAKDTAAHVHLEINTNKKTLLSLSLSEGQATEIRQAPEKRAGLN
jgi:hypothetical protein